MARPRKNVEDKRDKRLTFYMTTEEEERLSIIAEHLGMEKTRVVAKALDKWIQTMKEQPEQIKQAKYEKIMELDHEDGEGYICSKGHLFWLESTWPSPPLNCPACEERSFKRTWYGRILRGF